MNRLAATLVLPFCKNVFRSGSNEVVAGVSNFGGKAAQQLMRNIGMQLCFELRPDRVLAAQNPFFKRMFFQSAFQHLGDKFEMLPRLIGDSAFGVPSIVAREAVAAAAAARKRMKKSLALVQLAQAQVKQPCPLAIHENNSEAGECSQQVRQRLEMKVPVNQKLRPSQLRGKIILAPKTLRRAGKDYFGPRAIPA